MSYVGGGELPPAAASQRVHEQGAELEAAPLTWGVDVSGSIFIVAPNAHPMGGTGLPTHRGEETSEALQRGAGQTASPQRSELTRKARASRTARDMEGCHQPKVAVDEKRGKPCRASPEQAGCHFLERVRRWQIVMGAGPSEHASEMAWRSQPWALLSLRDGKVQCTKLSHVWKLSHCSRGLEPPASRHACVGAFPPALRRLLHMLDSHTASGKYMGLNACAIGER